MASVIDSSTPLRGDQLDAFLDQVDAIFENDDDEDDNEDGEEESGTPWPARQAAAAQQLGSHTLLPDDVDELRRIYRLWMMCSQPAQAMALVQQHQDRLLADLSYEPQRAARVSLAFMLVDAAEDIENRDVPYLASIDAAVAAVDNWKGHEDQGRAWDFLARHAEGAKAHQVLEHVYRQQHAANSQLPERAHFRAWDDAVLAIRLGKNEAAKGNATSARDLALYAMGKLQKPGAGQSIDTDDWLRMGDDLVTLAPDAAQTFAEHTLASLPTNASPAARRDTTVQLARLHARHLRKQGQLDAAIERGLASRFALNSDHDDSVSAELIDWLVQAGRLPEAAHIAFESALHCREPSATTAVRQALAHIDSHAGAPYWALTMLAISIAPEMHAHLPDDLSPEAAYERYSQLAQQQAPNHPVLRLLQGEALYQKEQYAEALPLLEELTGLPQYANSDLVMHLFVARGRSMGLDAALKTPFIRADSASWCYSVGVHLDDDHTLKEHLGLPGKELPENWPYDELLVWIKHYYETGQSRFEHFFATGSGSYKDGDLHDYSMLCNNLAIKYRYNDENYDGALALHAKGIATSPFAEHYNGMLSNYIAAQDNAKIITGAEQLWHYAKDNGYGRHDPTDYFPQVAYALYAEKRSAENSIWLERLDEWFTGLDEDEQREERHSYLNSLVAQLDYYSSTHGAEVLPRLLALMPELRATKSAYTVRRAGNAMETSGTKAQALAIYRDAHALLQADQTKERATIEAAIASLGGGKPPAVAGTDKAGGKPWWKLW